MKDPKTKYISWANFYNLQLGLIIPTMNTSWHEKGIRKLPLMDWGVPDISVVYAEVPFTYPFLITGKA